jgi:hypothetical protein
MRLRDDKTTTGEKLRILRNKVTSMVKRDHIQTNLGRIRERARDLGVLWRIANEAIGRGCKGSKLPTSICNGGVPTTDDLESATVMNDFYVSKINGLRAGIPATLTPTPAAASTTTFSFRFASAGRVSRIIRSLKNTTALGLDGIPVSVLKKGAEVLSPPLAHLINRSLSSGIVPTGFKLAVVHPIHKGGGKSPIDPASYRPVAILPAISKVLEIVVKEDLENHLEAIDALPSTQFGFRPRKSTTTALSVAHAEWIKATKQFKFLGILGFDLSSAFDTVSKAQLLPRLKSFGVKGTTLSWFESYLTGGQQLVDWNGSRSPVNNLEYGVRQGSILGPTLFLVLVSNLHDSLGIDEHDSVSYADDTVTWLGADDLDSLRDRLEARASSFACFAAENGLVMNSSKTQLMVAGRGRMSEDFCVTVNGCDISPSHTLELLGVKFDRQLSTRPYDLGLASAARQRANLIRRLTLYLPRGGYLRQIAHGLVIGKVGYAAAAVLRPRLDERDPPPSASYKSIQVAINDTARSLIGSKREDHIKVGTLLRRARLPSLNQIAVKAMALDSWKAFQSYDSPVTDMNAPRARSLISRLTFNSLTSAERTSRARTDGQVDIQLRGENTFVRFASTLWNASRALRSACTRGKVKNIATKLATSAPT